MMGRHPEGEIVSQPEQQILPPVNGRLRKSMVAEVDQNAWTMGVPGPTHEQP